MLISIIKATFFQSPACKKRLLESTSYDCPSGIRCGRWSASNIFTLEDDMWNGEGQKSYWLAVNGESTGQGFTLDLGCTQSIDGFHIKNTHNAHHRDHATKRFRVVGAQEEEGPWSLLLEASLEDSRSQKIPPVQTLMLDHQHQHNRYIKFELLEFWGVGGGLQFFSEITGTF